MIRLHTPSELVLNDLIGQKVRLHYGDIKPFYYEVDVEEISEHGIHGQYQGFYDKQPSGEYLHKTGTGLPKNLGLFELSINHPTSGFNKIEILETKH